MEPGGEDADADETPVGEGEGGDEAAVFVGTHTAETMDAVDDWFDAVQYVDVKATSRECIP